MARDVTAIVAAMAPHRGIGCQGQMPWHLAADLQHFKRVTTTTTHTTSSPTTRTIQNAVIMGRKTWESLPTAFRPLPNRINVILSGNANANNNNNMPPCGPHVWWAPSLDQAVQMLVQHYDHNNNSNNNNNNDNNNNNNNHNIQLGEIFIIGGGQVYQQAIQGPAQHFRVRRVLYTQVEALETTGSAAQTFQNIKFDTFFPELPAREWTKQPYWPAVASNDDDDQENQQYDSTSTSTSTSKTTTTPPVNAGVDERAGLRFEFWEYTRIRNYQEEQYLDLCRTILQSGILRRGDRTGVGTWSHFGAQMRFDLRHGTLPLLTTKRTFWRGVAEELLWFVSGNTNANALAAKDIHIWDGNGSREFLDGRGLTHRETGDLGPVYGFQWRHFGAKYVDMHTDYTGQGVDQLAECIDKIKNNPLDRRIILSAWNPADLHLMALPPCHMFCQFYVDTEKNELSCQMYQRSADMGLGVPFNIASYALLTHMMAHVTGRQPGDFVHTIGDAHVYLNHVDALQEQLKREPRPFPKLKINPEKKNIDDFEYADFEVIGYNPHKAIKMEMAV